MIGDADVLPEPVFRSWRHPDLTSAPVELHEVWTVRPRRKRRDGSHNFPSVGSVEVHDELVTHLNLHDLSFPQRSWCLPCSCAAYANRAVSPTPTSVDDADTSPR